MPAIFGTTVKKVVVGGDHFVGKTTLIHRSMDLSIEGTKITLGVNLHVKNIPLKDGIIKLQIWDFGGQEHYRLLGMFEKYCQGANAAILVFAQNLKNSFFHLKDWVELVYKHAGEKIPIIVVGNKADLPTSLAIEEVLQTFLDNYRISGYYEVSAKYGAKEWVDRIFLDLARLILGILPSQNK
ncbi:MAG: Rab family GTPase [Promethearchaeota archaeon]